MLQEASAFFEQESKKPKIENWSEDWRLWIEEEKEGDEAEAVQAHGLKIVIDRRK